MSERDLWQRCRGGDHAARNELVERHRGLVLSIVVRRCSPNDPEREDLVSEGMIGLIRAVERFDPSREVPFAGFAARWIKGSMQEYLRRLPWMRRCDRDRLRQTGETPTELLPLSEVDSETIEDMDLLGAVLDEVEREQFWQQVLRLISERQREALQRYYRDEEPGRQIAVSWGWHPTAFAPFHARLIAKLAKILEGEGIL